MLLSPVASEPVHPYMLLKSQGLQRCVWLNWRQERHRDTSIKWDYRRIVLLNRRPLFGVITVTTLTSNEHSAYIIQLCDVIIPGGAAL